MARSVTDLVLGSACGGWSAELSSSGFDSAMGGLVVQHEASAAGTVLEQHEAVGAFPTVGGAQATRRSSAASTAGSTAWALAQASVSAGVLQQHWVKHCSAVAQPQGLSMQGNGCERSLPASRLAAGESEAAGATIPNGNGSPEATSV